MLWILMAISSSFFAGLTAIFAKLGIKKTDSDVATLLKTVVVLIFSWIMVLIVGSAESISDISNKSFLFLVLSGIATGASWICYFKALSIGNINKVTVVDKSSMILSVLLAIILFGETNNLIIKLALIVLYSLGVFLMIEKKRDNKETKKRWLILALAAALFASLTTILAKAGIKDVDSNLATAIRTSVVLIMSFMIVLIKKKENLLTQVEPKEMLFIFLSGVATGASWLCYYYAIQNGIVSVVVPIDKMSALFTILFSFIVFKERISKKSLIGLILMLISTLSLVFVG